MSRPPATWLSEAADLIHTRPELAGIGLTAAATEVTSA